MLRRGLSLLALTSVLACGQGSADNDGDGESSASDESTDVDSGSETDTSSTTETTETTETSGGDGDGDGGPCTEWELWLGSDYDDHHRGLVVGEDNDVFVTGYMETSPGSDPSLPARAFVVRVSPQGAQRWRTEFGNEWGVTPGNLVHRAGHTFVSAVSRFDLADSMGAGGNDTLVVQLDGDGQVVGDWLHGTDEFDNGGRSHIGADGNYYLFGQNAGTFPGGTPVGGGDPFISHMEFDGTHISTVQWGSDSLEGFGDLEVDAEGNLFLVGSTYGSMGGEDPVGMSDAFVAKLDAQGTLQWVEVLGGPGVDGASDVAIGPNGELYVTGTAAPGFEASENLLGDDAFLVKFDASGNQQWIQYLDGQLDDDGMRVVVDAAGDLYALYSTLNDYDGSTNQGGRDLFIRKHDPNGNILWSAMWGTDGDDLPSGLKLGPGGRIYIAGTRYVGTSGEPGAGYGTWLRCACAPE